MAPEFEEHLEELELGVRSLESGEIDLAKSLSIYEDAVKHLRSCHEILRAAENRVVILTESAEGDLVEEPFPAQEE